MSALPSDAAADAANSAHAASSRAPAVSRRAAIGAALGALAAAPLARLGDAHAQAAAAARDATPARFALEEATIADLQAAMIAGRETARSLVEQYARRIESLDRQGPALRQMIELNPDALAIADAMDAERKAGRVRGPLHGVPVLLKDNVATDDRMETTAGSLALVGSRVPRDAFLVTRLREAGAVILGKTNLSEWANFRSTKSSSGWSARGGQARNPYALDRSTSGSSSGSAGAIAASYAAVSVGTETDGSITSPAAACALVGIKPTLGLVSRAGIVPIAHSQDTAGPMARTVRDAAILLGALAGVDAADRDTAAARTRVRADYTTTLDAAGLEGARIGVMRGRFGGYHPATDRVFERELAVLKAQGAILVDPVALTTAGQFDEGEFEVLLYEFKADLNAYLAGLRESKVRTLADVIAFNEAHAAEEMPFFGQEIMLMAQKKGPLTTPAYRKALARNRRLAGAQGIDATLARHRLDALVAPTQGPAWLIDHVNGDFYGSSFTSPAAVAGHPHVTVPMGDVHGLPVGLSFVGRAWSEPLLLKLAYAYEQATRHRKPPTMRPTVAV